MKRLMIILALAAFTQGLSAQTIITTDNLVSNGKSEPRFRISCYGGLVHRFGRVDPSLDQDTRDFYRKLKRGKDYGADITYYLNGGYGFGVKYDRMSASNSMYGTVTYSDGTQETGTISDNIGISFIGAYASATTASLGSNHIFYLNYGIGYVGYKEISYMLDEVVITGKTLGTYAAFGYDYRISDHFALGAEIAMITGNLRSIRQTENGQSNVFILNPDEVVSLSRISANVGIRFYL